MNPVLILALGLLAGFGLGFIVRKLRSRAPAEGARPSAAAWPQAADKAGDQVIRLIADSVPEAVLFFSDLGVIRYANAAARQLFFEGRAPEGQNFIRLVADAAVPLREALLGDSDRLFTMDLDGTRQTYHLSRRTFLLDEELHTLLVVMHMTREIGRHEVEVLKRVVRVISHEVNNSLAPVTSLIHSARLIAKNPEHAGKLERVFDTVEERTRHLKTFLDGYATLARLPKPRAKWVEWASFLPGLTALYPGVVWPSAPKGKGYFDAAQIEQVLINLIKNAAEAGSAEQDIEVRLATHEDGATDIDVLDRGPGFSSEALKNCLMPLYTTKASGSGMGLSLSQEITEAHGGSIGVSNRPEGGAWIRVILPGGASNASADLTRSRLTLTRA
ncbi:MAG TPA: ATP-binding protein [Polyangiaceae bacterium]|jgi:nitrogen fixation/metabolism regulation signal transduction histidine kinase|nr:ATP-binding protein [Polyangiaceae bacterium]